MPLANNALVLVTDGRKTLFFRNQGDQNQIDLRTEAFDEREDLPNSELKSDAAGSNAQSGGFGRPAYEETDFHQQEEDRWEEIADKEQFLLTITENGYGKRSSTYEYRRTNRGGQGIINIVTSERNGGVIASFPVSPGEQLMLVTDQGKMIRTTVGDIRIAGRNTQGVTIFNVANGEKVVSVAKIDESDEEEVELEGGDEVAPEPGATVGEDLASGDDA